MCRKKKHLRKGHVKERCEPLVAERKRDREREKERKRKREREKERKREREKEKRRIFFHTTYQSNSCSPNLKILQVT